MPLINRRGFRKFEPEPERPSYKPDYEKPLWLGEKGVAAKKESLKREDKLYERGRQEEQDMDVKRTNENIMRAVFGDVGAQDEGGYEKKLSQQLIDPARPMTQGETSFREDPFKLERLKSMATARPGRSRAAPVDETEQAIADAMNAPLSQRQVVGKNKKGEYIYEEIPVTADEAIRSAGRKFKKYNPKDPRWEDVRKRFKRPEEPAPEPEPSIWERIKRFGGAIQDSFQGGGTDFATEEEAEAANLPPGTEITIGGRKAIVN